MIEVIILQLKHLNLQLNKLNIKIMAKPIKITPVLKGEDAIRFYKVLNTNKSKQISGTAVIEHREAANKFLAGLTTKNK